MTKREKDFVTHVWHFYHEHGRHDLPWRKTKNPYKILVSEVMLQQTQVDRVIPKYTSFLKQFPKWNSLADASLAEVLIQWQGLGYNRRAKMLHQCAQDIVQFHAGKLPQSEEDLCSLSGVGPYTAGAVRAFAFDKQSVIIETNIRTVFLHHFFKNKTAVSDLELLRYIEKTLDTEDPRQWYWALMDYGAFLKKEYGSTNNRSKHYSKQSPFKESDREIRGAILRLLTKKQYLYTKKEIKTILCNFDYDRVMTQLGKLVAEDMVVQVKQKYGLPT